MLSFVVKVMVVSGPIDKHWYATGCEISLVGIDVMQAGPTGKDLVIKCRFVGMGVA